MARRAYSTDLTDAQWALIEPFLQVWKAKLVSPSGYTGCYDMREIISALFYQKRTGCQ
jgi:transposase